MRIAIGSDHAGFEYKMRLKLHLVECGHIVEDFGTDSPEPIDYPLIMRPLAEAVAAGEFDRGIVLGGSGNGEAIVANRVPGIRCTLCWNLKTARWARQHNDANVLSLGQRTVEFDEARAIVDCWLETEFEGGRHVRRIRLIDAHRHAASPERTNGESPHRAPLVDEASFICDSCRHEFQFPVDISAGSRQELFEVCPVCCHENAITLQFNDDGELSISGGPQATS